MRPHPTAVILAALLSTTTAQSQTPGIPNLGSVALSRIDRDRLQKARKSEPTLTELLATSNTAKTHQSMVERTALRPLLPTVTGTATVQTAQSIDVDPPPLSPGFRSDRRQWTCRTQWRIAATWDLSAWVWDHAPFETAHQTTGLREADRARQALIVRLHRQRLALMSETIRWSPWLPATLRLAVWSRLRTTTAQLNHLTEQRFARRLRP